ncbi:MAG: glycosyltransferase [Deltaproteobacteria bacterium]|nr:glycosyltransferase [Deltaproteobacteria bacterium]
MENSLVKVDLHVHSRASQKPAGWFSRLLKCQESYSNPVDIYNLLKARGMDFVTITDHDTLDGVLEIAHYPDVFLGCEYTVCFPEEDAKIHVLVYGMDERLHWDLLKLREDVYEFVKYLKTFRLAHTLAHPLYPVDGTKITKNLVEKLVLIFDNWEIVNGTRQAETKYFEENIAKKYSSWSSIYVLAEKYKMKPLRARESIAFTAGSDDHGGLDAGRTWTYVENVSSIDGFFAALNEGRTLVGTESLGLERLLNTVVKVGTEYLRQRYEPSFLKDETKYMVFNVIGQLFTSTSFLKNLPNFKYRRGKIDFEDIKRIGASYLCHFVPLLLKYLQEREENRVENLAREFGIIKFRPPKIAYLTDTLTHINGVSVSTKCMMDIAKEEGLPIKFITSQLGIQSKENGINLEPVFQIPTPFYSELKLGVPNLLELLDLFEKESFTGIHVATPGPLGLAGFLMGNILKLPISFTFHTDLPLYIKTYTDDEDLEELFWKVILWLANMAETVFVPSDFYRLCLSERGLPVYKIVTFKRGVDTSVFSPKYNTEGYWQNKIGKDGHIVLYVGRVSKEKNIELIFKVANHFPGVPFVIVGDGPSREHLESFKPPNVHFTGYLRGEELSRAYASSSVFIFPSKSETYGLVVLEALASGLPVLVSSYGAAKEHITNGEDGFICDTIDDWVSKLNLLLDDPKKRLEMRNKALKNVSKLKFKESYRDYLHKLITTARSKHEDTGHHDLLPFSKWGDKKISM